ncbi:MAG: T9SS type A sorting domain-containing protein [bacterium]|nr:T9SS type A sorting domain-containing protein [bacterium]
MRLLTAVALLAFAGLAFGQLTGAKTINFAAPTAGNNYQTFAAAITALNASGVGAGGVTFTVASGTYAEAALIITTQTGTAANPIKFVKGSGTVTINSSASGVGSAAVRLFGARYVEFDGIDVSAANAIYGYEMLNTAAAGAGARNNTIRNCTVTVNKASAATRVLISNSNSATNASAINHNNSFINNIVHNGVGGIRLTSAPGFLQTGNVVMGNQVGVGVANDISGTSYVKGIHAAYQNGVTITDNIVANVTTTSAGAAAAIGLEDAAGIHVELSSGTITIARNEISAISSTGNNSFRSTFGIIAVPNVGGGNVANIYNNMITGITHSRNVATSTFSGAPTNTNPGYGCFGIYVATGTANVYHNSVLMNGSNLVSSAAYWNGGATANVRNNIFANIVAAQLTPKHYGFCRTAGTVTADYNNIYVVNANGFVGRDGTTDKVDEIAWNGTGYGANSVYTDPLFISGTDLHIQVASDSPVSNAGVDLSATVADDIDGDVRTITPDLGADEGEFSVVLPVELSSFLATATAEGIELRWRTETETDNDHFVLDRWVDGNEEDIQTVSISSLSRNGNSSVALNYFYRDTRNLLPGNIYHYRLSDVSLSGDRRLLQVITVNNSATEIVVPRGFGLVEAFPNPFNPTSTIKVQLRNPGLATVAVYNAAGQLVQELYQGKMGIQPMSFQFDASSLATGVYLVRVTSSDFSTQKKIVLMR